MFCFDTRDGITDHKLLCFSYFAKDYIGKVKDFRNFHCHFALDRSAIGFFFRYLCCRIRKDFVQMPDDGDDERQAGYDEQGTGSRYADAPRNAGLGKAALKKEMRNG
jgi:hypothetical protein